MYLTSELFRSTFGDARLFFHHELVDRDIKRLLAQGKRWQARRWKRSYDSTFVWFDEGADEIEIPDIPGNAKQTILDDIRTTGCPYKWVENLFTDFVIEE